MSSELPISNPESTSQESSNPEAPDSEENTTQALAPRVSREGNVLVKVYGLLGHTRCIDLEFSAAQVQVEAVFVFQGKRYKIASVIKTETHQFAINAVFHGISEVE